MISLSSCIGGFHYPFVFMIKLHFQFRIWVKYSHVHDPNKLNIPFRLGNPHQLLPAGINTSSAAVRHVGNRYIIIEHYRHTKSYLSDIAWRNAFLPSLVCSSAYSLYIVTLYLQSERFRFAVLMSRYKFCFLNPDCPHQVFCPSWCLSIPSPSCCILFIHYTRTVLPACRILQAGLSSFPFMQMYVTILIP